MNWVPINWDLAANPYNWLIITLMVLMAGMALSYLFHPAQPSHEG